MQTETAISSALRAAGWQLPDERLFSLALAAWGKYPTFQGDGARVAHVREALRGEMSWCLIEHFQPRVLTEAIASLLRDAAEKIAAEREHKRDGVRAVPAGGGANRPSEPQTSTPHSGAQQNPRGDVSRGRPAGGHPVCDTHTLPAPRRPSITEIADRQAAAMAAKMAMHVRLSKLDTFVANGQKIGDLTASEATRWAGARERDARFVRLLTANLPPDRPIREFVSAEEADKIYAAAEAQP